MLKMAATRTTWRRWVPAVTAAVTVGAAGLAGASPAAAQTLVNCPTQNLQTAINAAAPGSTLVIRGTCVGNFTVAKNLRLVGFGTAVLDGNGAGTTLTVNGPSTVQINSLTLVDGVGSVGGGLHNNGGTVTLNSTTVRDNDAGFGGGIANTGTLTVNASRIQDNAATVAGGGIANSGTLTVNLSTLRENTAEVVGGGLASFGGTVRLSLATVTQNVSNGGANTGGGIFRAGGTVTLLATSVTANVPNNCTPALAGCVG
ncbi:hypothetical protein ABZ070_34105 [Streptomyces sp. NPDC006283]|uniref:hypothetical protein n=1 Tax=Streptomyces sp. NPDC006283 TaxID=3156741 RepID=UPI00339DDB19